MKIEWLEHLARHPGLRDAEVRALLAFGSFASADGSNVFPSAATVMKRTGLSQSVVRRALRKARELGLVVEYGEKEWQVKVYRLRRWWLEGDVEPMGDSAPVRSDTPVRSDKGAKVPPVATDTTPPVAADKGEVSHLTPNPCSTPVAELLQENYYPSAEPPGMSTAPDIVQADIVEAEVVDREPSSSQALELSPRAATRPDVEALCEHLADRIEGNGSKRPVITKGWRDAARLLLDADGRTLEQVHTAIDWCQGDDFWRGNVLSMPTLRKQYDRLRLAAQRQPNRAAARPGSAAAVDWDAAAAWATAVDETSPGGRVTRQEMGLVVAARMAGYASPPRGDIAAISSALWDAPL